MTFISQLFDLLAFFNLFNIKNTNLYYILICSFFSFSFLNKFFWHIYIFWIMYTSSICSSFNVYIINLLIVDLFTSICSYRSVHFHLLYTSSICSSSICSQWSVHHLIYVSSSIYCSSSHLVNCISHHFISLFIVFFFFNPTYLNWTMK